jgi:hypothetical protein
MLTETSTTKEQFFSVKYGAENRVTFIVKKQENDPSLAVILAAVHFEWVINRAILVLGRSQTVNLRKKLLDCFSLTSSDIQKVTYKSLWKEEVEFEKKHLALGKVVTKLTALQNFAMKIRGEVIHGNGTVGKKRAKEAIQLFLDSAEQITSYVISQNLSLDKRVKARIKKR